MLRDSGVQGVSLRDRRHIEVVATGLSFAQGVPLAIDATLVSPLDARGRPHAGTQRAGAALSAAVKDKKRTYPELVGSNDLRLLVAAAETGGRIHDGAQALLWSAAADRVRNEPPQMRKAACRALRARWSTLLSVAA